jgi:hypothetical protein
MSASTSKDGEPSNTADKKTQNLPNLGVLEEDDEFEEFAVAGQLRANLIYFFTCFHHTQIGTIRKLIWLILEEHNLEQRSLVGTNSGKTIGMMMISRMNSAFN